MTADEHPVVETKTVGAQRETTVPTPSWWSTTIQPGSAIFRHGWRRTDSPLFGISQASGSLKPWSGTSPMLSSSTCNSPVWAEWRSCARSVVARPHIPVVVMTAFGGPEVQDRVCRLGASGYFDKPFRLANLVMALRAVARRSPNKGPPMVWLRTSDRDITEPAWVRTKTNAAPVHLPSRAAERCSLLS